jgi:hypothetical protein
MFNETKKKFSKKKLKNPDKNRSIFGLLKNDRFRFRFWSRFPAWLHSNVILVCGSQRERDRETWLQICFNWFSISNGKITWTGRFFAIGLWKACNHFLRHTQIFSDGPYWNLRVSDIWHSWHCICIYIYIYTDTKKVLKNAKIFSTLSIRKWPGCDTVTHCDTLWHPVTPCETLWHQMS